MDIRLKIEGMTCGGCKTAVERVLANQQGVTGVSVDLASGIALAVADYTANANTLISAVEDAGYEARLAG